MAKQSDKQPNPDDELAKSLLAGLASEDEDAEDDRAAERARGIEDEDMEPPRKDSGKS
jgi:hypothetical protein